MIEESNYLKISDDLISAANELKNLREKGKIKDCIGIIESVEKNCDIYSEKFCEPIQNFMLEKVKISLIMRDFKQYTRDIDYLSKFVFKSNKGFGNLIIVKGESFIFQHFYDQGLKFLLEEIDVSEYRSTNLRLYVEIKILIARNYYSLGKLDHSQDLVSKVEIMLDQFPSNDLIRCKYYYTQGMLNWTNLNYSKSLDCFEKSLKLKKECLNEDHYEIAYDYMEISDLMKRLGDNQNSERYLNDAISILTNTFGDYHFKLAIAYSTRAKFYVSIEKITAANESAEKVAKILNKLYTEDHPSLAILSNKLGYFYLEIEQFEKAKQFFLKAHEIFEKFYGLNHVLTADSLGALASFYRETERYNDSVLYFKKQLEAYQNLFGEYNHHVSFSYYKLGSVYLKEMKVNEAIYYFKKTLAIDEHCFGPDSVQVAEDSQELASAFLENESLDQAMFFFNKKVEIEKKLFGDNHNRVAKAYYRIGLELKAKKMYEESMDFFEKSLDIEKKYATGINRKNISHVYEEIGHIYKSLKDYDTARKYYQDALDLMQEIFGPEHGELENIYRNIGHLYLYEKNYALAISQYEKGLDLALRIYGPNHSNVGFLLTDIGNSQSYYESNLELAKSLSNMIKGMRIIEKNHSMEKKIALQNYDTIDYLFNIFNDSENRKKISLKSLQLASQYVPDKRLRIKRHILLKEKEDILNKSFYCTEDLN